MRFVLRFFGWLAAILVVGGGTFFATLLVKDIFTGSSNLPITNPKLFLTGIALTAAMLIIASARPIPPVHDGVVTRFGWRIRVVSEGLRFVIPGIDKVSLFNHQVNVLDIEESFFSKDNLEISIKGKLRWRYDPKLLMSTFMEQSLDSIFEGLQANIKNRIGAVAGTKEGVAFIQKREAVSTMVNCSLRMAKPPHEMRQMEVAEHNRTHLTKESFDVIEFYEANLVYMREHLSQEDKLADDRSEAERAFGIDIVGFDLEDVDFSEKTKEQFEKAKQAEADLRSKDLTFEKKQGYIESLVEKGYDRQTAANLVETMMSSGDRKIFSFEGLDKILQNVDLNKIKSPKSA